MLKWVTICWLLCLFVCSPALAETLRSSNFQVDESFVGGGGLIEESSANYRAGESIGDVAVGDTSSDNFSINSGYTTTSDPTLAFAINVSGVNFGTLSAGAAATATSTFEVTNYTSYGYAVQLIGTPPSNRGHSLPGIDPRGPSQAGVEQYGINVVANSSPVSFGANPDNGGGFGRGAAVGDYAIPDNYKYVSGETIAAAPKSSGLTSYTISYLINVSSLSPGGVYSGAQTLVCTGTY